VAAFRSFPACVWRASKTMIRQARLVTADRTPIERVSRLAITRLAGFQMEAGAVGWPPLPFSALGFIAVFGLGFGPEGAFRLRCPL